MEIRIKDNLKTSMRYILDWWWQFKGIFIVNPTIPVSVSSIVFICKGNICRSVFAQYLMINKLKNYEKGMLIDISSSGIEAKPGTRSPKYAVEAAKSFGVDIERHRSDMLTDDIAETADMLIAMEPIQLSAMQKRYSQKKQNIYLLSLFENEYQKKFFGYKKYHIEDPYGKDLNVYWYTFERVAKCIDGILEKLQKN